MTARIARPHATELLASLDVPGEGRAEFRLSSGAKTIVLYVETQGGARATLYIPRADALHWLYQVDRAIETKEWEERHS